MPSASIARRPLPKEDEGRWPCHMCGGTALGPPPLEGPRRVGVVAADSPGVASEGHSTLRM